MCGRYFIPEPDDDTGFQVIYEQLKERYAQPELLVMKRGEIFPTNIVPIITAESPVLMKWGFSRFDGKGQVINARLETAEEKLMFKKAYASARCLVPAGLYFEWRKDETQKQKYALGGHDTIADGAGAPIYMAGLYRLDPDEELPLFVILTRPAAPGIAFIHDRMPVIVPEVVRRKWLTERLEPEVLLAESENELEYREAI
jgi:putative SOS response-associated peptidase YedK